jgi:hypothetical protein
MISLQQPFSIMEPVTNSGSSNHTTFNLGNISLFRPPNPIVGNESILPITSIGDMVLPIPFYLNKGCKVDFREGPALQHLDDLHTDESNHGAFDFAFIDANNPNYVRYHEQLLCLICVGGTIVYDNMLWGGTVALPP